MSDVYQVQTGTDWCGDAVFFVYNSRLRLTVAKFDTLEAAQAFIVNR